MPPGLQQLFDELDRHRPNREHRHALIGRRILGELDGADRFFGLLAGSLFVAMTSLTSLPARAADEAPDALVKRLSSDVLDTIKADKSLQGGDVSKIRSMSARAA